MLGLEDDLVDSNSPGGSFRLRNMRCQYLPWSVLEKEYAQRPLLSGRHNSFRSGSPHSSSRGRHTRSGDDHRPSALKIGNRQNQFGSSGVDPGLPPAEKHSFRTRMIRESFSSTGNRACAANYYVRKVVKRGTEKTRWVMYRRPLAGVFEFGLAQMPKRTKRKINGAGRRPAVRKPTEEKNGVVRCVKQM